MQTMFSPELDMVSRLWIISQSKVRTFVAKKVRNPGDIDDILQEVFIKFWKGFGEIKDQTKCLHWILSVTRFTIADYYRTKSNDFVPVPENYLSPEDITDGSDESKKLLPIIFSLPVKYRNILLLNDIVGVPHKVIAEQFNLTLSCVKTRVVRARKLLGERMHECCSFSYDKYGNIIECTNKPAYLDCLKISTKMPL